MSYDDVWWTDLMRAALRGGVDENVEPWLALFLQRRPGPISLWKRPAEFPVEDRGGWNRRLPPVDDLERRTVRPLSRLSSLVGALEDAWIDVVQVLAFADRPDRATAAEVLAAIQPTLLPEEPS